MSKKDKTLPKIRKDLFEYLSHLDKDNDFPALKRYLQSPFFEVESRDKVIQLFELLKPHHPDYKSKSELNISSLNKKIGITFVQNLKSTLVKCIEDYLRIKSYKENEHWSVLLLIGSLEKMNMSKFLNKYIEYKLTKFNVNEAFNAEDYFFKYQLLLKKHCNLQGNKERIKDTSLEQAIKTLSYYYLYSNLINLIAIQMKSNIFKKEYNIDLAKNMINSVLDYHVNIDPNITINYFIYSYYKLDDIKEKSIIYFNLKSLILDKWDKLTPLNQHEVYLNSLNISNNMLYNGVDFEQEQFEIHKFWIDKKVHKYYNEIDKSLFMSIVVSSCTVEKFDWCQTFIKENSHLLLNNENNETINYCKSYMYFKQRNYDEALLLLNTIRFSNPLYELNLKILEIKCLFEQNSSYRFKVSINNLRTYINRHKKLSNEKKTTHLKFIQYLSDIRKANLGDNILKLKEIRKKINKEAELNSKVWLVKKLNQLF